MHEKELDPEKNNGVGIKNSSIKLNSKGRKAHYVSTDTSGLVILEKLSFQKFCLILIGI